MNRDLYRKASRAGLLAVLALMVAGVAPAIAAERTVLCEEFTATW